MPLLFPMLEHAIHRFHGPPIEEYFLDFSVEIMRNLKERDNAEMTTSENSLLQSLLVHVWLAVTLARHLQLGCLGFTLLLDRWWPLILLVTDNIPQFDVFDNDIGWGRPVAVGSGAKNKVDRRALVYKSHEGCIGLRSAWRLSRWRGSSPTTS
ncbi:hypothetical protein PR202_ga25049 [Eleusine coracana subsp. coracana]|uniref:Uncharacterized protein n=1 Tax=Eleusine coracana subsp. coracana TaxID=191504 RepID=A0AAV5DA05_ELECO|nr:hypothetical protein PR202_ga25049 [Eleusine coracana subsp. coracana]